jgi:hypothetical protein
VAETAVIEAIGTKAAGEFQRVAGLKIMRRQKSRENEGRKK